MSDSNVTPMRMSKAFAHLDPTQNLLGGGLQGGAPVIGYKGKVLSLKYRGQSYRFTRADDGTASAYIDVIIVGANPFKSKVYFPGPYDEDSATAPVCTAVDENKGPDIGVPEPQAKHCSNCPRNVWGLRPDGKRTPECQSHKKLAVLLMPKVTARMLGAPLEEPVYLKIPPASFTPLQMYGDMLVHQGLHMSSVITRLSFSQDKQFQFEFKTSKTLNDEEAGMVLPMLDDPRTRRIVSGGQPEMKLVSSAPREEPAETGGLMETFGVRKGNEVDPQTAARPTNQTPAKRGRPPKPKSTDEDDDELSVVTKSAKPAGVSTKTVEGMSFLDEEPTNAISDKVKAMLNKDLSAMISGEK